MSAAILDDKGVITICSVCGQKNRTAYERLGEVGQCGRCKAELRPPSVPIEIDGEAHFNKLIASPLPVVVDFWAPWCGPCRMVAPEIEKVAAAEAGKVLVTKINTEALPTLGQRFGIQSIPTMAVFVKGREATRTAGARPAAAIQEFIRQAIGAEQSTQSHSP